MKSQMNDQNYYRDFIIIAILVISGAWISASQFLQQEVPPSFWVTFSVLALLSLVIHRFLVKSNELRPQLFVARFMGSLAVKLFLSAIMLLIVGFLDNSGLTFTAVGYLIGYLLLLVADIRNLLPLIRNSSH